MKPKGEWTVLSRKDIGLLVVIGVLFAALTFHVGLYWGMKWGLSKASVAQKDTSGSPHKAYKAEVKAPAQEGWEAEGSVPEELKNSYVKSKQNLLVETQLRAEDKQDFGRSIADAKAYKQKQKLDWGNAPTPIKAMRSIASEKEVAKTPKVEGALSSLFERSPASVKSFSPTFGDFTLQVASYATEGEAAARVRQMVASGVSEAYYRKSSKKGQETWYQVLVGSYKEKKWAQKSGARLIRRSVASDYFVKKVH